MTEHEADPVAFARYAFGGEDKRLMANEDKLEFIAQTHDHFGRTATRARFGSRKESDSWEFIAFRVHDPYGNDAAFVRY